MSTFTEFVDTQIEHTARPAQFDQFGACRNIRNVSAGQAVNLEIAIVAKHDLALRIDHNDALPKIVERRANHGIAPGLGRFDDAHCGECPQSQGDQEYQQCKNSERQFGHHAWLERLGEQVGDEHRCGIGGHRRGDERSQKRDRSPRCAGRALPVSASHHAPKLVSAIIRFAGWNRVNTGSLSKGL